MKLRIAKLRSLQSKCALNPITWIHLRRVIIASFVFVAILALVVTYWKKNNSVSININKGPIIVNCENPYANNLNKMVKRNMLSENEKNHNLQEHGPKKINLNKNQDRYLGAGPGTMSYEEKYILLEQCTVCLAKLKFSLLKYFFWG